MKDDGTLGGRGTVLAGRYRVVRHLGEGGMGSVWLAEDLKLDGRQVAVKMLPAFLANKDAAYRRVQQEALMAMKLSHPHIATVRAFEDDEGGVPFLVMDYIEGMGLDEILAEKEKLTEPETRKLLEPVAAALDYAHGKGVVHRDVKPGNVMVRKDGVPFVLDFGIARELHETGTQTTGQTGGGTLLYMSPEQLDGDRPRASQDVYSFAAMAYECLTGAPPFCRGGIEEQIRHKKPEELPGRVGAELRKGVMAGLAKVPENRPGSCAGVLGKSGSPRTAGRWRKAWGWGALAVLLIAACGAGVWWKGQGKRTASQPTTPSVENEKANLQEELRLAEENKAAKAQFPGQDSSGEVTVRFAREPMEEELAERIRAEDEKLEETVFRLATQAKTRVAHVEAMGYERGQGFGEKLDAMRDLLGQGEVAMAANHLDDAKVHFAAAMAAAAWCEENAPRRKAAREKLEECLPEAGTPSVANYLVVDLSGGPEAKSWPVTYLDEEPPDGFNTDEYKTTKLVLRQIGAGTFLMGGEYLTTLTKPFYMGVFEVTQKQWELVMGSTPSQYKGDTHPVESVSYDDIRGAKEGGALAVEQCRGCEQLH